MTQTIDFFFDIGSPYSYLAATQIPGLSERTGASVRWRPFLLGGVFRETGNNMPASVPAKARWMLSDMKLWSAHYDVPFQMSTHSPLNTLQTQRALIATENIHDHDKMVSLTMALYQAYWVNNVAVSEPDAIRQCATTCALDAEAILAGCADPTVKKTLIEVTAEAVKRGAFGAPAFFVGEQLFWGQDRIPLIESFLRS